MAARLFFETVAADRPLDEAATLAILEIAYFTMCADNHVDDGEVQAFSKIGARLLGMESVPPDQVKRWMDRFATRNQGADARDRLPSLVAALDGDARKAAYQVACVIALADDDESDREFEFDLTLIDALELRQEDADALAAEARAASGM